MIVSEEDTEVSLLDIGTQFVDAVIGELGSSALQKLLTKQSWK